MADRLVHTWYDFLREVIGSAAKSLSSRNGAKPSAAKVGHRPHNSRRTGAPLVLGAGCVLAGAWLAGRVHATETSARKSAS